MLPDGRRIGVHLPLGHGMVRAVERAASIRADVVQVFIDNPTAWQLRAAPPHELPAWRERIAAAGSPSLVVHVAYLVNLAGPTRAGPDRAMQRLAHELRVAPTFGAAIVNVHVGSHLGTGARAGIKQAARRIAQAFALADEARGDTTAEDSLGGPPAAETAQDAAPRLALEVSAGAGDAVGTTVEELADILDAAADLGVERERVGICLDTAHLWGGGHAIGDPAGVDAVIEETCSRIGLERLLLVHLNDSRAEPGGRTDRHAHLGAGRIGERGLRRFLTHPALVGVPYILETPGMEDGYDAVNLERARRIAAGEPLEPLPPEAMSLARGHGRAHPPEDQG